MTHKLTRDEINRAKGAWDEGAYGTSGMGQLLADLSEGKFRDADPSELPAIAPAPAPFTNTTLVRDFDRTGQIWRVVACGDPFTPAIAHVVLLGPGAPTNTAAIQAWAAAVKALGVLIPTPQTIATLKMAQKELADAVDEAGIGARSAALPMITELLQILEPPSA